MTAKALELDCRLVPLGESCLLAFLPRSSFFSFCPYFPLSLFNHLDLPLPLFTFPFNKMQKIPFFSFSFFAWLLFSTVFVRWGRALLWARASRRSSDQLGGGEAVKGGGIIFGNRTDTSSYLVLRSHALPITELNGDARRTWMKDRRITLAARWGEKKNKKYFPGSGPALCCIDFMLCNPGITFFSVWIMNCLPFW